MNGLLPKGGSEWWVKLNFICSKWHLVWPLYFPHREFVYTIHPSTTIHWFKLQGRVFVELLERVPGIPAGAWCGWWTLGRIDGGMCAMGWKIHTLSCYLFLPLNPQTLLLLWPICRRLNKLEMYWFSWMHSHMFIENWPSCYTSSHLLVDPC